MMRFKPTTYELEIIAENIAARVPVEKIAAALNVDQDVFLVWCHRLRAARALSPEDVWRLYGINLPARLSLTPVDQK